MNVKALQADRFENFQKLTRTAVSAVWCKRYPEDTSFSTVNECSIKSLDHILKLSNIARGVLVFLVEMKYSKGK